ncbi:MAG: hypothetical protein M3N39_09135 [Pseudomonadota bacterium]|nr:hypothetical protein [Pseudomonadota bacterium]
MQEGSERREAEGEGGPGNNGNSRPQRGGEAATTRFGMEDGDNTDVPATGGPAPEQEVPEGSR